MARGDDGDGAMPTYTTQRTHTLDSHICSHPHTHTSMHACMHACSPVLPRTAMQHTHNYAPQYTLHLHIPSAVQPHTHTLQHNQPPQHIATHTQLRTAVCVPPRSRRDRRQETAQTHITPTAITTTMTMCDDDHVAMPILPCV